MSADEPDDLPDWEFFPDRLRALWRTPRTLTAFMPVQDSVTVQELQARLESLNDNLQLRLESLSDLHSFRLGAIAVDASPGSPVTVLMNCVHDHSPGEHLRALFDCAGELLLKAVGLQGELRRDEFVQFVLKYRVRENTLFLGNIGSSVEEVLQERELKKVVQNYVFSEHAAGRWVGGTSSETIRRQVRNHFLMIPFAVTRRQRDQLGSRSRWLQFLDLLATFLFFPFIGVLYVDIHAAISSIQSSLLRRMTWLAYAAWWIYGAIPTAAGFLVSRFLELTELESVAPPTDESLVSKLELAENQGPMNAVTILFEVKDSWIRRWYLWMILRGAELGCRHVWTNGKLTGIGTIHYARIIQTHGGRRLLFLSDYDGSLNRYLDDFLGVGARAVIPFTSNLVGCPRTRWLFQMAGKNNFGPRWKGMIRTYQVFTTVWFHKYPNLTVREILDNAAFREELFAESLSPEAADRWARRL